MIPKSNLASLHDELDPLVREFFLQFVEGHELVEAIGCLKLHLLNVNVQLDPVRGTRLSPLA